MRRFVERIEDDGRLQRGDGLVDAAALAELLGLPVGHLLTRSTNALAYVTTPLAVVVRQERPCERRLRCCQVRVVRTVDLDQTLDRREVGVEVGDVELHHGVVGAHDRGGEPGMHETSSNLRHHTS